MTAPPELEKLRKRVDWAKANRWYGGYRWAVFAESITKAVGEKYPEVEFACVVYLCDLWVEHHACSLEGAHQLYVVDTVFWFRDGVDAARQELTLQDLQGQDYPEPLVRPRDLTRESGPWVLVKAVRHSKGDPFISRGEEDYLQFIEGFCDKLRADPPVR